MAEAVLANCGGMRPPWPLLYNYYGMAFEHLKKPDGLTNKMEDFHIIGKIPLTTKHRSKTSPSKVAYRRTYLVQQNTTLAAKAIFSIARMSQSPSYFTHNELPPKDNQLATMLRRDFIVHLPPSYPWPPRKKFACISARYVSPDIQLAFRLNKSKPYYVSNAVGYWPKPKGFDPCTLIKFPLAKSNLRRGNNRLHLWIALVTPQRFAGSAILAEVFFIVPKI